MKKLIGVACLMAVSMQPVAIQAESVQINGKDYEIETLEKHIIGPGTEWTRIRIPGYPLNVNLVTMDMKNPYVRVETMQASETAGRTESIVGAAKRMSTDGRQVLAGANGNFWCVSGQAPWSDLLIGTPFGGSVRNGKIVTETNAAADQWTYGPSGTAVIASDDERIWIEPMLWTGRIKSDKTGEVPLTQANKVVRPGEVAIYNSFFGTSKAFQPVIQDGSHYVITPGKSTEVYLRLDAGQQWNVGGDMTCTVGKVVTDDGRGTLGDYDLCLVAHDAPYRDVLARLAEGDKVTLNHGWTSYATGETPRIQNMLQGLNRVMHNGEISVQYNDNDGYNNQIYPKTAYGMSQDCQTLYILTIDKSKDPVYGNSAGCPSRVMCEIMAHYGCSDAATVDAGGSTQMMVLGEVVNKTTEGSPRAIANGWFVVQNAPEDNEVAALAFEDFQLEAPVYGTYSPRIWGYNKYGVLLSKDVQGVTLSCEPTAGSCADGVYTACSTPGTYTLTATLGNASVTAPITVKEAQMAVRIRNILIDLCREYPMEVTATLGRNTYTYNPADIDWTVEDASVAAISADGVLTGLSNGTTTITAKLGDFTDCVNLSVEAPPAASTFVDREGFKAEDWTITGTGIKDGTITSLSAPEDVMPRMRVDFRVSSTRGTQITLNNKLQLYSLPDYMHFIIKPGDVTITRILVKTKPANSDSEVRYTYEVPSEEQADGTIDLEVPVTEFGDPKDLAFYPLQFNGLQFYLSAKIGTYSMEVDQASVRYDTWQNSVEDIAVDSENADKDAPAQYYNLQGMRLSARPTAAGIYLCRKGATTQKILVR